MRKIALAFVLLMAASTAATPQGPGEPAYGAPGSAGRIYHVEYLRAFPAKSDDYDRFVKTVFRPMLDGRGVTAELRFLLPKDARFFGIGGKCIPGRASQGVVLAERILG